MKQYEVCDMIINIEGDYEPIIEKLSNFIISEYKTPDLNITFKCEDNLVAPQGSNINEDVIHWLRKPNPKEGYYIYTTTVSTKVDTPRVLNVADLDYELKNVTIKYRNNKNKSAKYDFTYSTNYYLNLIMGIIFRHRLLYINGIVMHASTLEWNGKGILFTAPSGTGKSTQVKLWQTYMGEGVRVLNDDTPAIKFIEDKPYVYGTPWCGSSDIHCNGLAPIAAIVIVEQAPLNSITKLSLQESIFKTMPRVFLPYFNEDMMNKTMNIFEKIITSLPIYLLKCKPEKEAVELVYECVK